MIVGTVCLLFMVAGEARGEYINAFECADEWDEQIDSLEANFDLSRARIEEEKKRGEIEDPWVVVYKPGATTVFGFAPLYLESVSPYGSGAQRHYAHLPAPKSEVIQRALRNLGLESCDWTTEDGSCIIRSGKTGPTGIQTFLDMKIATLGDGQTVVRCGPLLSDEWQYDPENPAPNGFECTAGGAEDIERMVEQGPLTRRSARSLEATQYLPARTTTEYDPGRFRVFGLEPYRLEHMAPTNGASSIHRFEAFFPFPKEVVITSVLRSLGKEACDEVRKGKQPEWASNPDDADVCVVRDGAMENGNEIRGIIQIAAHRVADREGGGIGATLVCRQFIE
ncbi:MAG: hypothetical protein SX243_13575 [Acidobacteriota bacterium]|nr:hypothetical protein [Acidobacteriota bacterium]